MKNLMFLFLAVFLFSCGETTWYESGHQHEVNKGTFIVNDSIEVVNTNLILQKTHDNKLHALITYEVKVNGITIPSCTSTHDATKGSERIINDIEEIYKIMKDKPMPKQKPKYSNQKVA